MYYYKVNMAKKGLFIVFEGGEGSGKSVQADLLYKWLVDRDYKCLLTKEPGGNGGIGAFIRNLLRDSQYQHRIDNLTELFLFESARAQHVNKELRPAIKQGKLVVCDRFNASTYAYQIFTRRVVSEKDFFVLDKLATGSLKPDFSFFIDIEPKMGLARKDKEGVLTRFEKEKLDFHKKVRTGYKQFFRKFVPENHWAMINGDDSIESIHRKILDILKTKQLI